MSKGQEDPYVTAIKLLVAAGHVSEEKANEALCIANGFSAGPLKQAPAEQEAVVYSKGDIHPSGEDGMYEAGIHVNAGHFWMQRIVVYGETAGDAEQLRDAVLNALCKQAPAEQSEYGDAYQGARQDMAIWKRRALEAEARIREQDKIIDQLGDALNAENGPTHMGEPVIPKAPAEQEPVAWLVDWPDEPELGHYFSEEPNENARSKPLYTAPAPQAESSRDWPEDFAHENGQYMCTCRHCKNTFTGYKRRTQCKLCATTQPAPPTPIAQAAPQPEQSAWIAGLLNRIIPRIDAGGLNPIHPDIHCCEWTLHRERERIHAEFADALAAHRKQGEKAND